MGNSPTYDEVLKRRLGVIQDQGVEGTAFAKQQAAVEQARQMAQQQEQYNALLQQNNNAAGNWQPSGNANAKPGTFDAFMNAITKQESGGNYGAVNSTTGALGRYQILPSNLSEWGREAGVGNISANQFLHSPEIQNRVARYKLQQYYNMYGAAGAAVAWYAGPGTAKQYLNAGGRGFGRPQGNYPSIESYVQSVLKNMGY